MWGGGEMWGGGRDKWEDLLADHFDHKLLILGRWVVVRSFVVHAQMHV